jgi:hypothetical protein
MKSFHDLRSVAVVFCFAWSISLAAPTAAETSATWSRGYVADAPAAVAIAKVVLAQMISADTLRYKTLFSATLKDGVWSVSCGELKTRISQPILIQIRQRSGEILRYEDPNA